MNIVIITELTSIEMFFIEIENGTEIIDP